MNKTAQIILNLIVGLVSFVIFVIFLFPLDSLIGHALSNIDKETKGMWRISVSEIDSSILLPSEFKDFRLYQKDELVFYAPNISAGISLLPLISGSVNVSFAAEYRRGEISGRVSLAQESVVDIELSKMAIKELDFVTKSLASTGFPKITDGVIDGTIYFTWSQDLNDREGEVNLKIGRAKLAGMTIKMPPMELPGMQLSGKDDQIALDMVIDKGQILINKLSIPGPDLALEMNGSARLNRKNEVARSKFDGRIKVSDLVKKSILELEMFDGQEDNEGYWPFSMDGNFTKPRIKIGDIDLSQLKM